MNSPPNLRTETLLPCQYAFLLFYPVFPSELATILHFVDFIPLPSTPHTQKVFVELMFSLESS